MTQDEKVVLAEIAVSEDQVEGEQEARDLQEAIALSEDESAARVVVATLVSLSETEDEPTTTMETHKERVETPKCSSSAQDASLSNTLTALTLAGAPVTNTDLDSVLQSIRNVVTVATASLGAEVEFTLRPRNNRPRTVECQETNTFQVNFLENTLLLQGVEVESNSALRSSRRCLSCSSARRRRRRGTPEVLATRNRRWCFDSCAA